MAKIIVKSSYLKPNARRNVGNYVRYIATREGVEKIDESKKHLPATEKQKQIIKRGQTSSAFRGRTRGASRQP